MPAELIAPALAKVKALLTEIEEVLAGQGRSERLRDGLVVAIAGPPNVGKSTLMNQLARREVAIVSPHAGTTRDVIEVQLDLDGYPVTVIDTAGHSRDGRSGRAGGRASCPGACSGCGPRAVAGRFVGSAIPRATARRRFGWCETRSISKRPVGHWPTRQGRAVFQISASRGDGVPELIAALVGFAQNYFGGSEGGLIGRTRQRKLLQETAASLRRCVSGGRAGRGAGGGRTAHGGAFAGAAPGARGCRGHSRRHLPGVLCR